MAHSKPFLLQMATALDEDENVVAKQKRSKFGALKKITKIIVTSPLGILNVDLFLKSGLKAKVKHACKLQMSFKSMTICYWFMLNNIYYSLGLLFLLGAYTVAGAYLFIYLEYPLEKLQYEVLRARGEHLQANMLRRNNFAYT